MSLLYTEEQKELLALVREMAENEIKPYVKEADEKGECPRELFKWGFDMGLHMLEKPARLPDTRGFPPLLSMRMHLELPLALMRTRWGFVFPIPLT